VAGKIRMSKDLDLIVFGATGFTGRLVAEHLLATHDFTPRERDRARALRARVEKLACGFPMTENYFAWQAFGRAYGDSLTAPTPPYLERGNFLTLRAQASKADIISRKEFIIFPDIGHHRYPLSL
jgi:S-adenosylmethionine:diacylglycerol 3-amino-3-carboxypropyl transferase